MKQDFLRELTSATEALRAQGLFKSEALLATPQQSVVRLQDGRELLNLCANNYLGLANHPQVKAAARQAIDDNGYGMSSVRFICGTHTIHRELERRLSGFLRTDDTILYSSCFDANGGLFETLLDDRDVIISDALNHASIIDGVRLSKAQRLRYANGDLKELEDHLQASSAARVRLIATDGVFSMDGVIAPLKSICDLADRYDALVMVDDSHATGFVGATGRGTHELHDVMQRVDILTGTLGKALGGGSGGYTSGRQPIVNWLRQRSRPYLFSNSIPPAIAAASLSVLDLLERGNEGATLRERLWANVRYFREAMSAAGFTLAGKDHAIVPIMLHDAQLATEFAKRLADRGILAVGFSFPVVPQGKARIRTQMSAAHTRAQLEEAVASMTAVGRELNLLKSST
ncbi:MAG TPA: glycine C-acetyltransferase [Steroidobacteraceae bacterium]|nr:glycine C-acetyltransferase [Steroidobacteraceae bacterium]